MEWTEQHLQMGGWFRAMVCASGAYLLGCFATGYYLVRARTGKDLRETGSGSTGARNAGRVLGWPGFAITVLGDFFKGSLAVWMARESSYEGFCAALALLAVVAGHLWPVQLRFRGGKGIATSLGALLVFDYRLALSFAVLFGAIFMFSRKTFLPAMFAVAILPLAGWYFCDSHFSAAAIAALSAAILFAHRRNFSEEMGALKAEPPKI